MARELERRYLTQPVELRKAGDGPGTLVGYAAKYGTLSQNLGGFVETIAPGAFDKSLADGVRVLCRYNHKDSHLLGTTEAGTLTLSSDDVGLPYEVDLPDTSSGRDVGVLAARGDVRFSSFAFYCIEDEWSVTEQGFPLRTLKQVQLVDVAPVNSPAYMDTSVAKRSLADRIEMDPETHNADEIVAALRGEQIETPETDAPEGRQEADNDAQGDTHATTPASVQRLLMELAEQK